jgi:hypothetical protein
MNPNIDIDIDTTRSARVLTPPLWSIATAIRAADPARRPARSANRRPAAASAAARAAARRAPGYLQPFAVR